MGRRGWLWYNSRAMTTTETTPAPTPPVGVIESISQGFETVAGRLVLLLVPLLLDAALWVGPRVSFAPAIERVITSWDPIIAQADPQTRAQWDEAAESIRLGLGGMYDQYFPVPGIPTVFAAQEAAPLPFEYTPSVWIVESVGGLIGVRLLALLIGVVVGTLYLGMIAQQVFEGRVNLFEMLPRLFAVGTQIGIISVLLPVLMILLLVPFFLLATGIQVLGVLVGGGGLGVIIAQMTLGIGLLLVLWMFLFGVFTIHGMFLNRRNLLSALWDSIRVVQWNLSSTLLLVIAVFVIRWALALVWFLTEPSSWLALLASAGNAFATTSLLAATFVFYKDRYRYWRQMREALLAELQRRRSQDRTQL